MREVDDRAGAEWAAEVDGTPVATGRWSESAAHTDGGAEAEDRAQATVASRTTPLGVAETVIVVCNFARAPAATSTGRAPPSLTPVVLPRAGRC